MDDLSRAQRETYVDMVTAPEYDMGSHQWCDTHIIREESGRVIGINGNWNSTTLKALERKGYIDIVKDGGWWNDIVITKV